MFQKDLGSSELLGVNGASPEAQQASQGDGNGAGGGGVEGVAHSPHPHPRQPWTHAGRSRDPAARSPRSNLSRSEARARPLPGTGSCRWSWGTASTGSIRRRGRRSHGTRGRSPLSGHFGSRCSCTAGSSARTGLSLGGRQRINEPKKEPTPGSNGCKGWVSSLLQKRVNRVPRTRADPRNLTISRPRGQCSNVNSKGKASAETLLPRNTPVQDMELPAGRATLPEAPGVHRRETQRSQTSGAPVPIFCCELHDSAAGAHT